MSKADELKTDDPEVLQSQMQASLGLLRAQIASYVQKEDKGKKFSEVENVAALQYTVARPDRLGVGAKFLSHNDAVRSDRILSKSDQALKNKMFKGERSDHNPLRDLSSLPSTRYRAAPPLTVADNSEEEESKFSTKARSSTQARPTALARKFATTAKQVTDGYLNSQAKRPPPPSNFGEGTKKKKKKKKNNTVSQ